MVNFRSWPSSAGTSVTSTSGWPSGRILFSSTAWPETRGSASLTASCSTAPRPTRWSMIRAGILPARKPGTLICEPIVLYAASRLGLSSSKGTSTVSLTRVGLRVSTALFTTGHSRIVGGGLASQGLDNQAETTVHAKGCAAVGRTARSDGPAKHGADLLHNARRPGFGRTLTVGVVLTMSG